MDSRFFLSISNRVLKSQVSPFLGETDNLLGGAVIIGSANHVKTHVLSIYSSSMSSPPSDSDDAPIWHRLLNANAATEKDAKSAVRVRAMVKNEEVDPPTADPYIPPAEGCSAGCHCKHPGGQENIDGCTHPCSNCGGIFHSVLFCGAHFSDVESKHCTSNISTSSITSRHFQALLDDEF